ncbi:ead/Ea22-like family protein [Pseudomonas cichorii]|nr:ead/Ea22-like family protein [Pseudomonas cichorii]MBX8534554.1 ead/Ea22-like family protein [Pseudomonas cichorii]
MTIDKAQLKALAEAATAGPWIHGGTWVSAERGSSIADCSRGDEEFIAAANPATILALLEEIDRLHSAEKTLQSLGYRHAGGEMWKPPLGTKPDFSLIDQLKAERELLQRAGESLKDDVVKLKAENEALAHLLKRFVDGEHDDVEDQSDRHHYHGEAQALLARMGGDFQEYSLVPYEALWRRRTELVGLRKALEDCAMSLEGETLQKFAGQKPEEMHPVTRRDYDRDMAELAGYRAVTTCAAPCESGDLSTKDHGDSADLSTNSPDELAELRRDAGRYRWLRNPYQDVGLVLDKKTGHVPVDEQGFGGYGIYEYRSGVELDEAIDAAMTKEQGHD